jgi:hypothetical protein
MDSKNFWPGSDSSNTQNYEVFEQVWTVRLRVLAIIFLVPGIFAGWGLASVHFPEIAFAMPVNGSWYYVCFLIVCTEIHLFAAYLVLKRVE